MIAQRQMYTIACWRIYVNSHSSTHFNRFLAYQSYATKNVLNYGVCVGQQTQVPNTRSNSRVLLANPLWRLDSQQFDDDAEGYCA